MTIAVIGAGAQAELVLRGLASLRRWSRLEVFDIDSARAERFAERHRFGASATSPRSAVRTAQVVLVATWSRVPILDREDVAPGTHITSLGADERGKGELTPRLLQRSRLFVDDVTLANTSGALGTARLGPEHVAGTLTDVLQGRVAPRTDTHEVTIYSPVGLPWQDLAVAWLAYERALRAGHTRVFDFLR